MGYILFLFLLKTIDIYFFFLLHFNKNVYIEYSISLDIVH